MRFWTPAELAGALRRVLGAPVTPQSIQRACESGEIPARRTPGGHWRIADAVVSARFPVLQRGHSEE